MSRWRIPSLRSGRPIRFLWGPIAIVLLIESAGTLEAADAVAKTPRPPRPNFLFLVADDVSRDDCGAFGHPHIRTANIDRLAERGMRFTRAFMTCSSCSPSRASMMTGRYPHATGAHQLHVPLPAEQVIFPEVLRAAGYYTAAAGKWHLGPAAAKKLDVVRERPLPGEKNDLWFNALKQRPVDRPFCLWFGFFDAHRPFDTHAISPEHVPTDAVVPPYLPGLPETRRELAAYYDEISRMDGEIGRLIAELDRQGAAENTVIVFLGDNGRPFPRCKTTVYDSGLATPLIICWPRGIKAGVTCQSLVSAVDLAPTVLQLAGLVVPETIQGRSFATLFSNPGTTIRDAVFAERNWHDYDDCGRSVRTRNWKYIRNYFTDVPATPPSDIVRGTTFQAMLQRHKQNLLSVAQRDCFEVPRPTEQLFDLEHDPDELQNLAADPASASRLNEMRATLERWRERTRDFVPERRRPDEYDRETGRRLPGYEKKAESATVR